MKNYWNAFVVVASLLIFSSCSLTQPGSQQVLVADDLYDSFQKPAAAYAPKKSSHYLDPEEDATLIQEEDGVVIREDETNFLNSRSVYNSYAQGFNSGFQSGIFSANPWNNWYTNPYITFGLGGFYGSRIIAPINAWGMYDPFYNPYSFYSPYSYYDPFYGFSGLRNPYGYSGFGMGGLGYMGNYGGYNGYNGFGNNFYYAPSVGNVNREPAMRPVRGPREDRSNNQYGSGNMNNTPRGGNNSYNTQGNNLPRVNMENVPSNSGSSSQQYVAPRRNSNYEYRASPIDGGSSQRSNSTSTPSYSSPSSGGSSSGGGGGGSSRGPR